MLIDPVPGSGLRALVDTGAPATVTHRAGDGYAGATLEDIEWMAGFEFDLLLGLDAFRRPVLLTREFVEFDAGQPDGDRLVSFRGGPEFVVDVMTPDERLLRRMTRAYFDSGAKHSYVRPGLPGSRHIGTAHDFHPAVGHYPAMQFTTLVEVGVHQVPIEPIVPILDNVRSRFFPAVTDSRRGLLLGSELLLWGDLWLNLPDNEIIFRRLNR
jgi:hypothetical protein